MPARKEFDPMHLDEGKDTSLLENPLVLNLVLDINNFQTKIARRRRPKKEMADDGYLRLYSEPTLRISVIVQFVLDYFCKNPKLLMQEIARRDQKKTDEELGTRLMRSIEGTLKRAKKRK